MKTRKVQHMSSSMHKLRSTTELCRSSFLVVSCSLDSFVFHNHSFNQNEHTINFSTPVIHCFGSARLLGVSISSTSGLHVLRWDHLITIVMLNRGCIEQYWRWCRMKCINTSFLESQHCFLPEGTERRSTSNSCLCKTFAHLTGFSGFWMWSKVCQGMGVLLWTWSKNRQSGWSWDSFTLI
jgi:hypothetical protein